jgi:hypothetical protein
MSTMFVIEMQPKFSSRYIYNSLKTSYFCHVSLTKAMKRKAEYQFNVITVWALFHIKKSVQCTKTFTENHFGTNIKRRQGSLHTKMLDLLIEGN